MRDLPWLIPKMKLKYPCICCGKRVQNNQNAILCIMCDEWCHLECSEEQIEFFKSDKDWICQKCCWKQLPFTLDETYSDPEGDSPLTPVACSPPSFAIPVEQIENLKQEKGLKITHLNCLSLTKNIDELRHLTHEADFDILTLSETHLNAMISDSELGIASYNFLRKDRNRAGGGVAMYLKGNIVFKERPDLAEKDLEMIVVEVMLPNVKSFFVVVWYRPPNANSTIFQLFEAVLQKLDDTGSDYLLLGDMNCDMLSPQAWHTRKLCDITQNFGLVQCIKSPTRVTAMTSTLVDVILTNNVDKIRNTKVLPIALSDHYLVYCVWGRKKQSEDGLHKFKYSRNIKKLNLSLYKEDIASLTWTDVLEERDAEKAYILFENKLKGMLDKHAPLKKKRVKKKESPWITECIIKLIRNRNKQKKKAKNTQLAADWNQYRVLRNKVTAQIRLAKKEYISASIVSSQGQSGDIWKALQYVLPQKNKTCGINQIVKNGVEINDTNVIAETLNSYFANIGKQIQETIAMDGSPNEHEGKEKETDNEEEEAGDYEFDFREITEEEVLEMLNGLEEHKASGLDNIPASLIKPVASHIVVPLTHIFNMSVMFGSFPQEWKLSRVTPIHKGGDKNDMGNYRPISVLPTFAKMMEKFVFKQYYSYLIEHSILTENQFGFRPQHSTETALLNVTESWSDSIDEGKMVGVVALDLKKAFDTVHHGILLFKLKRTGLSKRAFKWFQSYLQNRYQCTVVNGVTSSMKRVECGIPQGSNLGPLLFIIYINDLTKCIKKCKVSLYADDTCVYFQDKNPSVIIDTLNEDLKSVNQWLTQNKLALNTKKCEFLLIGSRKRIKDAIVPGVSIKENTIERVRSLKYLGVMIDEHLDWTVHVETLRKKIVKDLYLLRRIKYFIGRKMALTFYKSIIQSKFDYCSVVWGNVGKGLERKLQILQNRAVRTVMGVDWTVSSDTVFDTLKLDRLQDRRIKRVFQFMYKIVHDSVPQILRGHFVFKRYNYNLRQTAQNIVLPPVRTELKRRSISYYGTKLWNNLTDEIKTMSWGMFKRKINNDNSILSRVKELSLLR